MRTPTLRWLSTPLLLLTLLAGGPLAQAYYDPGIQRWINRDPRDDNGFLRVARRREQGSDEDFNLYSFVGNTSIGNIDSVGLKIFKCIRRARTIGGAYHAYLWDDKQRLSCGRTGWAYATGEDAEGDTGPGTPGHTCVEIPGSEGKEADVMDCCRSVKLSFFVPIVNDCHNWVDRCLNKAGLDDPLMERFYDPEDDLPPIEKSRGRPGRRW